MKILLKISSSNWIQSVKLDLSKKALENINYYYNKVDLTRSWWPSGLSRHVSNSSRDRVLGPRFESHLRHVIKWYHNGPGIAEGIW